MSRRYSNMPSVNASLLHELRMFLQQFTGGRVDNYYAMRAAEAQAKAQKAPALKCARCIEVTIDDSRLNDAITIYDGSALCKKHLLVAMNIKNRAG